MATLYNLNQVNRESASELHTIRDKADQAISSLRRIGRSSEELLSDLLVYFISHKLDPTTRRAWKLKCSSESSPPSYESLTQFLSTRALALEEIFPKQNDKPSSNVKTNTAIASNPSRCDLCSQMHMLFRCTQFARKSLNQRIEFVKQNRLCFNCLSSKHSLPNCPSKFSCRHCQNRHHTLLHKDSASSSNEKAAVAATAANASSASEPGDASSAIAMSAIPLSITPSSVLLATARVVLGSPTGRTLSVRALIDQGSEVTFVTEHIAQTLRLRRTRTLTTISAVGCAEAGVCRCAASVTISSRHQPTLSFSTLAYILPSLTKYVPRTSIPISSWTHLSDLSLADDDLTGSAPINMIIGAELYSLLIVDGLRKGRSNDPIAQRSHLGWIISGPTGNSEPVRRINAFHCSLGTAMRRFWEIEEIPTR